MYFEDLHRRLLDLARQCVRSGAVSERGLARACGLSQPHMHNVLKDIRALSPASADRLLRALDATVTELVWERHNELAMGVLPVPMLRDPVGQGSGREFSQCVSYYPVPSTLLTVVVSPLIARLSPDPALPRQLAPNDLALLDLNPEIRANPGENSLWIVSEKGGLRARYVKTADKCVFVANEANLRDPRLWQPVAAGNTLDTVRARIVWISREMETEPARPAGPVSESD